MLTILTALYHALDSEHEERLKNIVDGWLPDSKGIIAELFDGKITVEQAERKLPTSGRTRTKRRSDPT